MVRYIKNDELYHYQIHGAKWGVRRFQYEDGTYTPEGRERYGIGVKKAEKTGAERIIDTAKDIRNTLAKKGFIKYRETKVVPKGDRFAKARLAKKQKQEKKEADEAYAKRQEQISKAKEKIKEFAKDVNDRIVAEDRQHEHNVDKAKQNRWAEYSDEDLKRYAARAQLEAAATEARLRKLDAPRQMVDELVKYGKTGLSAFNAFQDIRKTINDYRDSKVPTPDTPVQKMAKDLLGRIEKEYNEGNLNDPDAAAKYKEEIYKQQQMLEATAKVFQMTKADYRPNDKSNKGDGKDNGKNKNNENQPNNKENKKQDSGNNKNNKNNQFKEEGNKKQNNADVDGMVSKAVNSASKEIEKKVSNYTNQNKSDSGSAKGIHGIKWGVRKYQNKDGTLTKEGIEKYINKNSNNSGSAKGVHGIKWGVRPKEYTGPKEVNKISTGELETLVNKMVKTYAKESNVNMSKQAVNNRVDSLVEYIKDSSDGYVLTESGVWALLDKYKRK